MCVMTLRPTTSEWRCRRGDRGDSCREGGNQSADLHSADLGAAGSRLGRNAESAAAGLGERGLVVRRAARQEIVDLQRHPCG